MKNRAAGFPRLFVRGLACAADCGLSLRFVALCCCVAAALQGCGPSWSPVQESAGGNESYELTQDGHYRVRRGDSLYTIAFRFGLDWRDIAEWNGVRAPYVIYPDQELRLSPPRGKASNEVVTRAAPPPAASVSQDQQADAPVKKPGAAPATPAASPTPPVAETGVRPLPPVSAARFEPGKWRWPTDGRVLSSFRANDPSRNGIEIAGSEGQPVVAAAAGEVVYSGSGLIGYGELIIVKHNDQLLSAYAHNRRRLVSEGQAVAAGELLAEMGRNDRNQPMLHFEIRVNGTPQDPLKYLPGR